MKQNENIILVDWDTPKEWKFKNALEKFSGTKWSVLKSISNMNHGGSIQKIIRYMKYFAAPLYVFIYRHNYSKVLAWQQFYGLMLAFYFRLFKVQNAPQIYVMTFIYKSKYGLIGKIYEKFMRYVVSSGYIETYIVFSQNEPEYYSKIFGISKDKFVSIKLGELDMTENIAPNINGEYFLSAGRSNRDYSFLFDAWQNREEKLEIICDCLDKENTSAITVNRTCYNEDYFHKLARSFAVIVPLDDTEISSGQLVIIQALMYGKPCIVTENKTIYDYIEHERNGIIIKKDRNSLDRAIEKLQDPDYYNMISLNARKCYLENFSDTAMGASIGRLICTRE